MKGVNSLTVSFVTGATGVNAGQAALSVDVDEVATGVASPYPPKTEVILRLFGKRNAKISATALGCSISLAASNQTMPHTEVLTVVKSARLNLSYQAKSEPALKWLALKGSAGAAALDPLDPASLVFAKNIHLGVCEVTYDVSYEKYKVQNLSGQKALVLFEADDNRDCSTELEIQQPDTSKYNLTLTLTDYSIDNLIIPGATVVITGPNSYYWSGQSDSNGQIILSGLSAGEYSLTAAASGYQSTGSDILANDRFSL